MLPLDSLNVTVVTAFPDLIRSYVDASIVGRGIRAGLISVKTVDIRDHSSGAYRQIDDYSYGGGGMVLMADPLERALDAIAPRDKIFVIAPTPQGVPLTQEVVEDIGRAAMRREIVIVCGHYEGIDERFMASCVDLEVSLGDFVLTGGELPALALIDATARLVTGVVGRASSVEDDSFYTGMLDHPHWTRPDVWNGVPVPEVLTSGNDALIAEFRRSGAISRTLARRPDAVARAAIMPYLKCGAYAMLLHHPVLDRHGDISSTAITGLDVHDIARACRTYGMKRFIIVNPMQAQREIVKKIAALWSEGDGADLCPDRSEALKLVKVFASYRRALEWIKDREHEAPLTIATTAHEAPGARSWLSLKMEMLTADRPVVFMFGTGHGLSSDIIEGADRVISPIRGADTGYDHLSVRSAASITFDRFFGLR